MLEISGSYLLNGIALLAIIYIFRTTSTNTQDLAVMKARLEGQDGDIKEIKRDVKHILERLPKGA